MLDELSQSELPAGGSYLWRIYGRLRARKGGNGFGPLPLDWRDIAAFCDVTGVHLTQWEIETIEALDDVFMAQVEERARSSSESKR